jgi:hypothetical protein
VERVGVAVQYFTSHRDISVYSGVNHTPGSAAERKQLGAWRAGGDLDTERLRMTVTAYRTFLDRVLSM